MSFIPKKIKDLFKKKAKPKKIDELKPFLQKEGYYLLGMDITKDEDSFLIKSNDIKDLVVFYKMKETDLATTIILNASIQGVASIKFDMSKVSIFFKHKNSDLYINGNDKAIGLPVGSDYQIVLIPKTCKWRPEAKAIEEVSTQKPTVLKPPM